MHGAIDLVARVDGMVEALDFKTHRVRAGEEAARVLYAGQCDLYATALGELLGGAGGVHVLLPGDGWGRVTASGREAVEAARGRLVERVRAVRASGAASAQLGA